MGIQLVEYWRGMLKKHLAAFIFLLFALQPIIDVISFWLNRLEISMVPILLLRILVVIFTVFAGYAVSHNRRYYWYLAAICVIFFVLHAVSCLIAGYISPLSDLINYARVIQAPLFTLCFISFMRSDTRTFRWINVSFFIVFVIITVINILSIATSTNSYTYPATELGILGWFRSADSQACILSIITPILLCMAYHAKRTWILAVAAILNCAQLYFIGTRLAYIAIFVSIAGVAFVTAICGNANKVRYIILAVIAAICLVFIRQSPMYQQQQGIHKQAASSETEPVQQSAGSGEEADDNNNLNFMHERNQIYVYYCPDMVQRFGIEKVIQKYNYTTDISEITSLQQMKFNFCSLLMDELPFMSTLFGIERDQMEFKGQSYDVENDFHGIYFLYGIIGLILFLAFLAYFFWLIFRALAKGTRKYFTIDAGAYCISLLLALMNAYNTSGILRGPNAPFYIAAVLAAIYYLVKIKKYPKNTGNKKKSA